VGGVDTVYDEDPLRRKLHRVLDEDVSILRRQGGGRGLQRK